MSKKESREPHLALTTNGVDGACAAAAVLLRHPDAEIRITSHHHLPSALERLRDEAFAGTLHLCGIGADSPVEAALAGLKVLADRARVRWYYGAEHPEVESLRGPLEKRGGVLFPHAGTDTDAVLAGVDAADTERGTFLAQVAAGAAEAARKRPPQSELHRFCRDLVAAANRRFYFFGDDDLNMKTFQYLAGRTPQTPELEAAVERYRESPDALYPLGSSRAVTALRLQIGRMGPIPEPVLITGPTGAGKEIMARALHVTSGCAGAFVAVNCAVLGGNPTFVEDRLFGHVKGAYTGAAGDARGAFEEANGGTLFLDEIAELPPEVQAQLLRVLEEGTVRPLGTMKTRPVTTRIIAATHSDLRRRTAAGTFRADLFYRLNVLTLRVPPLRERPEDMKSIAEHILRGLAGENYPLALTSDDWKAIRDYDWPGNVRQFLNALKRAAYLRRPLKEVVEEEARADAPDPDTPGADAPTLYCPRTPEEVRPAAEVYAAYIRHALALHQGNITQTAKALGVAQNTVRKHAGG